MRGNHGFTLIEVIAALGIIALGLVGLLSLFPVGIDQSKRASDITNTSVLAQSKLEEVRIAARGHDRGDLLAVPPSEVQRDWFQFGGMQERPNRVPDRAFEDNNLYRYTIDFRDNNDDSNIHADLLEVRLKVWWPSYASSKEKMTSTEFVTFIRPRQP